MPPFKLLSRFLSAFLFIQITWGDGQEDEEKSMWYTRYPHYPEFCSTPEQMKKRSVPPLSTSSEYRNSETRLAHVTAVLQHGARTIFGRTDDHQCWEGFWDDPTNGVWDCPLTTMLAPPDEDLVEVQAAFESVSAPKIMLMCEKVYDALGGKNILNGTCKEGQLLLQGYDQAMYNGVMLRNAYLFEEGGAYHDESMRLFDVSPNSDLQPWDGRNIYLRAPDSQRTQMTGQLLLRGLFQKELEDYRNAVTSKGYGGRKPFPVLPVHTSDFSQEIMNGYQELCPRLAAIQEESLASKEYNKFYRSKESKEVREFMESQLVHDPGLFDCLMTTVCTDRTLPERFQIYNPHPQSWFNRIEAYHTTNHSFHLRYNDSEYAKVSMGPLWAEILEHITPVIEDEAEREDRAPPPAKLAVYSGFDHTIMQVLSSLGPHVWEGKDWPAYASMILIEIHEMVDDDYDKKAFKSNFAFRLLYNGETLTDKIKGCIAGEELCDVSHLMDRVRPFAIRGIDCTDPRLAYDEEPIRGMEVAKSLFSKLGGILLALVIFMGSAFFGAAGMFFCLTGVFPSRELILPNSHSKLSTHDEEDDGLIADGRRGTSLTTDDHIEMTLADAASAMEGFEEISASELDD